MAKYIIESGVFHVFHYLKEIDRVCKCWLLICLLSLVFIFFDHHMHIIKRMGKNRFVNY